MQISQRGAGFPEGIKSFCQWHAWELLGKVGFESFAIKRGMQDPIDIIENSILGYCGVSITVPKTCKGGIKDVVYAY